MADYVASPGSGRRLGLRAVIRTVGLAAVTVNAIAFAALLVLLTGWPVWVALLLSAISLGSVAFLVRSSTRPVGTYIVARVLLVAVAAVQVATEGGNWTTRIALGIIGLLVLFEPILRRLSILGRPFASRIPGVKTREQPWFNAAMVFFVNGLGIIALLVTAFAEITGWIVFVWALVCLLIGVAAGLDALDRTRQRRGFESGVVKLMADRIRPVFAIHWDAPAGTAYQIAMWLPFLERLGPAYFILVRTEANFREVLALGSQTSTAPVILRKNLGDLDAVIAPTMKAIFYVNTATKNAHTIRYSQLTHIQLNHGDSDKAPSYNPVFRMYDKNFVAGQAAIDRFSDHGVDMPAGIFSIVGRPQVERVQTATTHIADVADKTVLYAPTWAGFYADSNYSSLAVGFQIVESLLRRGCSVIFRPHPYARRSPLFRAECARIIEYLSTDATKTSRKHRYGPAAETRLSVFECFNASDAMIGDISSVAGDYLYSEKPFAIVAVSHPAAIFAQKFPISRAAYVIDAFSGRAEQLESTLDVMLGADPRAEIRHALKTYYLGDIPTEHYADRFLQEARKYL